MDNEWQDMKSAPRDGSPIIITSALPGAKLTASNTYIASFWEGEESMFSSETGGAWICYMDMVKEPEAPIDPVRWKSLPQS
ncbi:hypothetical protein MUU47_11335 [Scandinavium sp. H11S7]|uniref:DUF551 domain-containing protein n=2 Tax=Scandinavium hiltneri TaxID=2926519 RepID=A0ABT2E1E8_9ENTR|nr:hypothetical protein [Scandinavium hiltneri]